MRTNREQLLELVDNAAADATNDDRHLEREGSTLVALRRWEDTCRRCGEPIGAGTPDPRAWGLEYQHGCGYHNSPTTAEIDLDALIDQALDDDDTADADDGVDLAAEAIDQALTALDEAIRAEIDQYVDNVCDRAAETLAETIEQVRQASTTDEAFDVLSDLDTDTSTLHIDWGNKHATVTYSPTVDQEALADHEVGVAQVVSLQVLLPDLGSATRRVERATRALEVAQDQRDEAIRAASDVAPVQAIAAVSGLSRPRIYQILE